MSILGLILITMAKVLHLILNLYSFIVLGAVIISWVRPDPYNPIVNFLTQTTEPVFRIIRQKMPRALLTTGIDFTPILVFIAIMIVDTIGVGLLMDAGISLRYGMTQQPVFQKF